MAKTKSQIIFHLYVGKKGSSHITFMYERKEKPVEEGGGESHIILCSDQCTK